MTTLLALAGMGALAGPAQAVTPDREGTVTPTASFEWTGATAAGTNIGYDSASGEPCGKTTETYCDVTLLNVDPQGRPGDVRVELPLGGFTPPTADFDLYVYNSDASGNRGTLVDLSGEVAGLPETVDIPNASGYYLVQVVYFAVVPAGNYKGRATFRERPPYAAVPPDVDSPTGLQDVLASDPSLGFRSRSEMHIAQNPLDPNILIAGSKLYNRDPDSLAEYEFKVGTYVSFDRGRTWRDLGQTAVCPPEQAPPESWPNNTCYPDEDPAKDGTGAEDGDRGGGGDFGEEYITSDPWVSFDDEGNAYFMVLDAPPYDKTDAPFANFGWGMSFHRWESVSPQDLEPGGKTWGPRISINDYPEEDPRQELFLDDKNTFAVSNAGGDGDGSTGTIVSCWGQNINPAKQQIVCERSTDGGKTWPGEPIPISGAQELVLSVHVVADPENEGTYYAVWNHYITTTSPVNQMWFSKSIDGGQTWTPPSFISSLGALPRQFPGQSFRNFAIPIMAVDPSDGELYLTYADYRAERTDAPDLDGSTDSRQADIVLVKSADGGVTWSSPVVVNQDVTNADQFQPYVDVTPQGQVNVAYFDRRHDLQTESGGVVTHAGNLFIDQYLSRSNDGGATFQDIRLSHDMWDPRINPPVSTSGDFIGDYQGLVVNNCDAVTFFQDTHLANDPARDPEFDDGLPRSEFQEAFAWRVPNSTAFGGEGQGCGADLSVDKSGPATAKRGKDMTYTIVVKNDGPEDAQGVVLTDNLPKSAGFGSFTTTQGTCTLKPDRRLLTCNLGSLANQGTAKVTVVVKPTKQGTITNTASVRATSPNDPVSANNSDSVTTTVSP